MSRPLFDDGVVIKARAVGNRTDLIAEYDGGEAYIALTFGVAHSEMDAAPDLRSSVLRWVEYLAEAVDSI